MEKIKNVFLLICGVVIGTGLSYLLNGCGNNKESSMVTIIPVTPKKIIKEVKQSENVFQKQADSLKIHGAELSKKLAVTKSSLADVSQQNRVLQSLLYDLVDKQQSEVDTSAKLIDCDSLNNVVSTFLMASILKDSLQEEVAANMNSQLQNKDSVISLQDDHLKSVKATLNESLSQQQILYDQNALFKKQLKRQHRKGKLISFVATVLAGFAATQLIQH